MALFGSMNTGGLRATPDRLRQIAPPQGMQMPQQAPQMAQPQMEPQRQEERPGFFDAGGGSQYVFAGLQDFMQRRMGEQPTGISRLMQVQAQQRQQLQQAAAERAEDLRKRSLDREDAE